MAAMAMVLTAGAATAQPRVEITRDIAGSRDHALVPRYDGSFIIGYKTDRFAEVDMPLGPVILHEGQRRFERLQSVEGARTRLLYVAPPERTSLEVMRNYRGALVAAGFQPLFECNRDACGDSMEVPFYFNNDSRKLTASQVMEYAFAYGVVDPRLLVAKLERPQGSAHVIVFAAFQENSANAAAGKRVAVFVDVVESGTMEQRMVTVQAPEMATNLSREGKQALYGIYFDFDKADIKPESRPQLEEMAKLMKASPGLKVYIVGHTDNQGALDYNVGLSQRRAEAVARALATQHGVPAARMTARGLGPLAPVTSNATDDGRAKNRRVELVQQ
jgi:outer membrane protein OmpA-like peptidoglycan-associated protein